MPGCTCGANTNVMPASTATAARSRADRSSGIPRHSTTSADPALVADAKYRPLDRLSVEAQREINDQLLRYMGLLHAPTGLILWPGLGAEAGAERCRVSVLPGGRARLVRLRLHPADPPGQLAADLRRLGLLWGPEVGSD